jgi:hypothetical protein
VDGRADEHDMVRGARPDCNDNQNYLYNHRHDSPFVGYQGHRENHKGISLEKVEKRLMEVIAC